jgi:hypothetical protein
MDPPLHSTDQENIIFFGITPPKCRENMEERECLGSSSLNRWVAAQVRI